jgi:hypothetical protein
MKRYVLPAVIRLTRIVERDGRTPLEAQEAQLDSDEAKIKRIER